MNANVAIKGAVRQPVPDLGLFREGYKRPILHIRRF
jgi:hypothetical protein